MAKDILSNTSDWVPTVGRQTGAGVGGKGEKQKSNKRDLAQIGIGGPLHHPKMSKNKKSHKEMSHQGRKEHSQELKIIKVTE